jgi:hypothetical protein
MHLHVGVRHDGRRPSMRIARVALRAYEQRTERRAWMRAWMVAHLASAPVR